jgi:DNA-binding transcriptional regulator YiaG
MPNLSALLKQEMSRISRREINAQTAVTRRSTAQHRRDLAELKRLVRDLSRRVAFLEGQERKRVKQKPTKAPEGARFSASWLKSHRDKLGISAADYARLVGVSSLTIYNWEHGRTRPREKQLAALAAVRGLGKREALRRLELLEK